MSFCKSAVILLYLLLASLKSYCQSEFVPGYLINNYGDSIYGYVDNRGDARNASVCIFKETLNKDAIQFSPLDLKSYRQIGKKYFVSKEIQVNTDDQSVDQKKNLFLEMLVEGIINLFFYKDESGESHYYIEDEEGLFLELTNEEKEIFLEDKGYYKMQTNSYIGLLKAFMKDGMELSDKIEKVSLGHNSLIEIAVDYHNLVCEDEECIVYSKQLRQSSFSIGPFISFNHSTFHFENLLSFPVNYYDTDFSISYGAQLRFTIPSSTRLSVSVSPEIGQSYYYAYGEDTDPLGDLSYDFHYKANFLKITGLFSFNFPSGTIRPSFGIGYGVKYNFIVDTYSVKEIFDGSIVQTYITRQNGEYRFVNRAVFTMGLEYHKLEKAIPFIFFAYEKWLFVYDGPAYTYTVKTGVLF